MGLIDQSPEQGMHAFHILSHEKWYRLLCTYCRIKITFKDSKGNVLKTVEANEGDNILDIAQEYDIDIEGACEGSCACSTCHVILEPEIYDKLPEPDDDENDMLDMAFGLTDTSRLGCQVCSSPFTLYILPLLTSPSSQVILTKELDGMVATLPSATRNMYVDGMSIAIVLS